MSQRLFRNLAVFNVFAGVLTVGLVTIALITVYDDGQSSANEVKSAAIANCRAGAATAVAQLNFDFYVYDAAAKDSTDRGVPPRTQANLQAEAAGLLRETKIRAERVDVSALRLRGHMRLIDPRLRAVVRRIGFRCSRQYR